MATSQHDKEYSEYLGDGGAYAADDADWDYVTTPAMKSNVVLKGAETKGAADGMLERDEHKAELETQSNASSGNDGWLVVDTLHGAEASTTSVTDCRFDTPTVPSPSGGKSDGDEDDQANEVDEEEEVEEEEEEEEMRTTSRDYVSGDDDWELEQLLRRRRAKVPVRRIDDDGEEYYDVHEYLCKWKRYDDPTWEGRLALEELGHVDLLEKFDYNHRADMQGKSELTSAAQAAAYAEKRKPSLPVGNVERLIGLTALLAPVLQSCQQAGVRLLRYAPVHKSSECEQQFLRLWILNYARVKPRVMYSRRPIENFTSSYIRTLLPTSIPWARLGSKVNINTKLVVAYLTLPYNKHPAHVALGQHNGEAPRALLELQPQIRTDLPYTHTQEFCMPLWVMHCRPLHRHETGYCDAPRVTLEELLGEDDVPGEEGHAHVHSSTAVSGSVKMTSAGGEVYYKQKRVKKQTKPKTNSRNQQSQLRLDKMR